MAADGSVEVGAGGMNDERTQETSGGDGYVYCRDCAGGFLRADICQNLPKCTLGSGPIIADLLYLNKVVKKKKKIIARQWDQCSNGET